MDREFPHPHEFLPPVDYKPRERPIITSPAHDLASLRWEKKSHPDRDFSEREALINKKWRLKFSIRHREESYNALGAD